MYEGIVARAKFTGWLILFSLPLTAEMWSRHLDWQILQTSYLPALTPIQFDIPDEDHAADQSPAESDDAISSALFSHQDEGF